MTLERLNILLHALILHDLFEILSIALYTIETLIHVLQERAAVKRAGIPEQHIG